MPIPLVTKAQAFRPSFLSPAIEYSLIDSAYFCAFPPNWSEVLGISSGGVSYFNPAHPLLSGLDETKLRNAYQRISGLREKGIDVDWGNVTYAICDFLDMIGVISQESIPDDLIEARFRELIGESKFFGLPGKVNELLFFAGTGYFYRSNGDRDVIEHAKITQYLPAPPVEWTAVGKRFDAS